MQPLRGVVQHYAWGDHDYLPQLLGAEPDGRPWAELWLGTHAGGAATLSDGRSLASLTGPLPYLLKVLAAIHPLSLQAHPDADQAADGHAAGRYPDPGPKPELLVALTPFEAFCGVRPVDATLALLDDLGIHELAAVVRDVGPAGAMAQLYHGHVDVEPIVAICEHHRSAVGEADWLARLAERYPGDPSVAVTLLLNLVRLTPGEAMHIRSGTLHAYLHGAGIELMAASDNIVRGGLTVKPVDVDDLLRVVDPTPLAVPAVAPAGEHHLDGTGVRLVTVHGPGCRIGEADEVVVTTSGATGYLGAGEKLEVAEHVTAYVATAS